MNPLNLIKNEDISIQDKKEAAAVTKYTFWSVQFKNLCIALNEDLSEYAQGDTFWQALRNLSETLKDWTPAANDEETDFNRRIKMYNETGINKVEIFVDREKKRVGVRCANSRSLIKAKDDVDALKKYIETRAKTSVVNTGKVSSSSPVSEAVSAPPVFQGPYPRFVSDMGDRISLIPACNSLKIPSHHFLRKALQS